MVIRRVLLLVVAALIVPGLAGAITPDQLRALSGQAADAARERAGRVSNGDLSGLLPDPKARGRSASVSSTKKPQNKKAGDIKVNKASRLSAPPVKSKQRVSRKYSSAGEKTKRQAKAKHVAAVKPAAVRPSYIYVPPERPNSGGRAIFSDSVAVDTTRYGISIGTWIDAELLRDANNAESGVVAIRVVSPVSGTRRTLPTGTQFFAGKGFNAGTRRLELLISQGVTPDGKEFEVSAQVYDLNKSAGLSGIVKKREFVKGGVQRGLVAAGRAAVAAVAGTSPVSAGLDAAAGTMLDEGDSRANNRLKEGSVIYVSRQRVKVFILRTF